MNNVSQRFKIANSSVVKLTDIAQKMVDIGIYDREEHLAMGVLVGSLSRAMKLLDPDRYSDYLDDLAKTHEEEIEKYKAEHSAEEEGLRPGHYL